MSDINYIIIVCSQAKHTQNNSNSNSQLEIQFFSAFSVAKMCAHTDRCETTALLYSLVIMH